MAEKTLPKLLIMKIFSEGLVVKLEKRQME